MSTSAGAGTSAVPYRRTTRWLLFGIPILCLLLSTCGAAVVLAVPDLKEQNLPPDGGGQLVVEASESSCWHLQAFDERHPDGTRGESEGEVSDDEVVEEGLAPFRAKGCGSEVVQLPPEHVFGAVFLDGASSRNDDTDPVRKILILVWLSRRSAYLGSALSAGVVKPVSLYAEQSVATEPNPASRAASLTASRSSAQALSQYGIDPESAPRAVEESFQSIIDADSTDVGDYGALARRTRQEAEFALQLSDTLDGVLSPKRFPVVQDQEEWLADFRATTTSLAEAGSRGEKAEDALIDIAFDRQRSGVRSLLTGSEVDRASDGLNLLRALRPARTAEIGELAAEVETKRANIAAEAARQAAEAAAEQERLDDLYSGGSGTTGGTLSCDGDGDGVCYE